MNRTGLLYFRCLDKMTVYTNDPIRVKITEEDIIRLTHKRGIDSAFAPSAYIDEWYLKLVTSDTNPHNPAQEHYKEDLEHELGRFHILQDHIREFGPYKHFNTRKSRVIETILDEKVFSKENRYDILLDKAKEVHRLQNGYNFGIIEDS